MKRHSTTLGLGASYLLRTKINCSSKQSRNENENEDKSRWKTETVRAFVFAVGQQRLHFAPELIFGSPCGQI